MKKKHGFILLTVGFLLLCLTIAGFASVEIYLRITGKHPTQYIEYDELLIYRMKPGDRVGGFNKDFKLHINSNGFRGDEIASEKPVDTKRIVFLGDSYTAGLDYADSLIFVNVFQQLTEKTEVINASAPGWATDQQYAFVTQEMIDYQPDVLIWMMSPNDIREAYMRQHVTIEDNKPVIHENRFTFSERMSWSLKNTFHTYNWYKKSPIIYTIWNHYPVNFGIHDSLHWNLPLYLDSVEIPQVKEAKQLYKKLVHEVKAYCDQHHITLLATAIPMRSEFNGKLIKMGGTPHKMASLMKRTCQNEGIPFLDLNREFEEHPHADSLYISWEFHFNEKGHALVGKQLSDFYRTHLKE